MVKGILLVLAMGWVGDSEGVKGRVSAETAAEGDGLGGRAEMRV